MLELFSIKEIRVWLRKKFLVFYNKLLLGLKTPTQHVSILAWAPHPHSSPEDFEDEDQHDPSVDNEVDETEDDNSCTECDKSFQTRRELSIYVKSEHYINKPNLKVYHRDIPK